ncbi:hypothetical protein E3N88_01535 [Mikania micrantha]|uniref:Uncharacterized protein n=1 Tax=Mikania micrantha TaxID=192012 RepID=A0A5N6Q1C3_9ASTR|nr:hypothetical protein E3N88_01535 [Mikania micrantha]
MREPDEAVGNEGSNRRKKIRIWGHGEMGNREGRRVRYSDWTLTGTPKYWPLLVRCAALTQFDIDGLMLDFFA